jgi:hypothetical protein
MGRGQRNPGEDMPHHQVQVDLQCPKLGGGQCNGRTSLDVSGAGSLAVPFRGWRPMQSTPCSEIGFAVPLDEHSPCNFLISSRFQPSRTYLQCPAGGRREVATLPPCSSPSCQLRKLQCPVVDGSLCNKPGCCSRGPKPSLAVPCGGLVSQM